MIVLAAPAPLMIVFFVIERTLEIEYLLALAWMSIVVVPEATPGAQSGSALPFA